MRVCFPRLMRRRHRPRSGNEIAIEPLGEARGIGGKLALDDPRLIEQQVGEIVDDGGLGRALRPADRRDQRMARIDLEHRLRVDAALLALQHPLERAVGPVRGRDEARRRRDEPLRDFHVVDFAAERGLQRRDEVGDVRRGIRLSVPPLPSTGRRRDPHRPATATSSPCRRTWAPTTSRTHRRDRRAAAPRRRAASPPRAAGSRAADPGSRRRGSRCPSAPRASRRRSRRANASRHPRSSGSARSSEAARAARNPRRCLP